MKAPSCFRVWTSRSKGASTVAYPYFWRSVTFTSIARCIACNADRYFDGTSARSQYTAQTLWILHDVPSRLAISKSSIHIAGVVGWDPLLTNHFQGNKSHDDDAYWPVAVPDSVILSRMSVFLNNSWIIARIETYMLVSPGCPNWYSTGITQGYLRSVKVFLHLNELNSAPLDVYVDRTLQFMTAATTSISVGSEILWPFLCNMSLTASLING